mgnify:CR=1 FL=1
MTNFFEKISVAELLVETGELNIGDNIFITGPTTGVVEAVISEIRIDDKPVSKAVKGIRCSIPLNTQVRRADKVYRKVESTEISLQ